MKREDEPIVVDPRYLGHVCNEYDLVAVREIRKMLANGSAVLGYREESSTNSFVWPEDMPTDPIAAATINEYLAEQNALKEAQGQLAPLFRGR